jgi:hypothetical protein
MLDGSLLLRELEELKQSVTDKAAAAPEPSDAVFGELRQRVALLKRRRRPSIKRELERIEPELERHEEESRR